jgi:leucyl-tRNA synthetase
VLKFAWKDVQLWISNCKMSKCMYDHRLIEKKWAQKWADDFISYERKEDGRPKKYILFEFPYPSGAALHIGHVRSHVALDIQARKSRMSGVDVLFPMGWDAFGLPTEQYAIKTGVPPQQATKENIATFKNQLMHMGLSVDWSTEVNTTDPKYYKWTQWIFLQMFKHGLAYQDTTKVWWCEELKTVLANEEVIDGKSERGGHPCERVPLRQWMLAITKYADRLQKDLDDVDFLDVIKTQQRNWIGKSEGARITFAFDGVDESLEVYTTRPDTLYGVTYMVMAPEHPLVAKVVTDEKKVEVEAYIEKTKSKSELERQQEKEKTGVFTGAYVKHPLTGEKIPVWVADYVLYGYGTGAIMAVPAHDERDREFAEKFDLPIVEVVKTESGNGPDKNGVLTNSQVFNNLSTQEGGAKIVEKLAEMGVAQKEVQFKLRDWVFSRQRYWGEPFPIVWVSAEDARKLDGSISEWMPQKPIQRETEDGVEVAVPVAPDTFPVVLPEVESYEPQGLGEGPLAQAEDWVNVWYNVLTGEVKSQSEVKPSEEWVSGRRETDTMPNWAGSSWYYLRYIDAQNDVALADFERLSEWLPVDVYNGGMEHVTLHLLYSRFWHKFLYDIGVVPTPEPYQRRIAHGMILAEGGVKMSKSKGNTIDPMEIVDAYGADALRMYEMFMGPYDEAIAWDTNGLVGVYRFLTKVWHWGSDIATGEAKKLEVSLEELERDIHALIKRITEQVDEYKYNTCVSAFMEFLNKYQGQALPVDVWKMYLVLMSVFVPHLTEELWEMMEEDESIHAQEWPTYDEAKLETSTEEYQVHVNGKMRAMLTVDKDISEEELKKLSLEHEDVQKFIEGKDLKKHLVISARNIVIIVV